MLLITLLTVHDAVSLLQCSQRAKYTLRSYLGAINFALTRPCFNGIGSPLTLAAWQCIWQACADFAEAAGLDVGVWSHASEIASVSMHHLHRHEDNVYRECGPDAHMHDLIGASRRHIRHSGFYAYLTPQGLFTRMQIQTLEPLITLIMQRAELQSDLASVLLVKGNRTEHFYTLHPDCPWAQDIQFSALAVAVDMTFVHIRCSLNITHAPDVDVQASIHVFNNPMPFPEFRLTDGDPMERTCHAFHVTCHNVQNVLLSAFEDVYSLSISKREFHLSSSHVTSSDLHLNLEDYDTLGTLGHCMLTRVLMNPWPCYCYTTRGGPIRRVARDASPYTCMAFIEWYGWNLGRTRWNEAPPWSVNSTRLAEVLRQSRAPGTHFDTCVVLTVLSDACPMNT